MRKLREATLERARSFVALPYDEKVSEVLASLLLEGRRRRLRVPPEDSIIAATAVVHGLTVWTLDRDFLALAKLETRLAVELT